MISTATDKEIRDAIRRVEAKKLADWAKAGSNPKWLEENSGPDGKINVEADEVEEELKLGAEEGR